MSIEEAVQLVLQAAALAEEGEVFTLDMGEPVGIHDLARRVIRLSGHVPDKDIPIVFVGARPGEKLHEEVVDPGEEPLPSDHPGIVVARPPVPDRAALRRSLRELELLAVEGRPEDLAARIKSLAGSPVGSTVGGGSAA
jgi:FlaA1/EpsC-like NDP-sugar epimerase